MSAFDLLSPGIRRFIRDQRWEDLRPIQVAAIERITGTSENYVLSSRTASGKTEAAFLPILSIIDPVASGVQVLYISPLIALINDQFFRIEELIKHLDIKVTKWHGEASRSQKELLVKDPSGILFITPESIEAMFVNRPQQIGRMFGNVQFVIVDEVHSFLGTKRGIQLKSLLSRLRTYCPSSRYIGLSATIGDYETAREFFGQPEKTKILRDKTQQPVEWTMEYFPAVSAELPETLLDQLYQLIKAKRCLVFPNSRGRVEEIAVKLKKRIEKDQINTRVFAHHSSIDRKIREFAEHFAKTDRRTPFTIVATSTLELGIDIGSIDLIVQIDSTGSVSSLSQRLGRSGRHERDSSHLALFVTDEWHLLQSLACMSLLREGILESINPLTKNFDILFHQALSLLKQTSGLPKSELLEQLEHNFAFSEINNADSQAIVADMVSEDYIEEVQRELIVGIKSERLVNSKDFYSVFDREDNLKVVFNERVIGELQPSPDLKPDQKVYLAAQMWTIIEVDFKRKKIYVRPAHDAKRPAFVGSTMVVAPVVRERMLNLLYDNQVWPNLSIKASGQLRDMSRRFQSFELPDIQTHRPATIKPTSVLVYTFTGTKINRTLCYALVKVLGKKGVLNEHHSTIELEGEAKAESLLQELGESLKSFSAIVMEELGQNEKQFTFSKWGEFLSLEFKHKLLLNEYFDVEGATQYCDQMRLVLGHQV